MNGLFPTALDDADRRLERLAEEARRQLSLGQGEAEPWVTRSTQCDAPVAIVGAGQAGLATAFGLRRKGFADVVVIDAERSGSAGPWARYARMLTLRTPKNITWPTWGVPAATPRAWFEAKFGEEGWARIEHIPTVDWHAFLDWYRRTLSIDVLFATSVDRVCGGEGGRPFTLGLDGPAGRSALTAHRIVFATGLEGAGSRRVPSIISAAVPADRWAHTHDAIDFSDLAGRRVGVLGGGTGAFDNAATALDAGAASADVHMRRAEMPTVSPYRWMEFAGLVDHYAAFSDEQKWAFNSHLSAIDQPATQNALHRAYSHPAFSFLRSSPWESVEWDGDEILVRSPRGVFRYDFVIAATGVSVDLDQRPELSAFVDDIARWGDVHTPDAGLAAAGLAQYPYLDDRFGCTSRSGTRDDQLGRLHLFNHGARMSLGVLSHQISGLSGGVERLVSGIAESAFRERSSELLEEFIAYDTPVPLDFGPWPAGRSTAGELARA